MIIPITLSDASITEAINRLNTYRNSLEYRTQDLVSRLGNLGLTVVSAMYSTAEYPGTNDVRVSVEFGENTCTIHADGKAVAFIEFGAGINYPEGQYAGQVGALPHGMYGKHQGANPKGWAYYGEAGTGRVREIKPGLYRTKGNPPLNAFPAAVETIRDQVETIVKEVFGNG